MLEYKGRLFFFGHDHIHGKELWSTDGTPEGTTMFKDIYPGTEPCSYCEPGLGEIGNNGIHSVRSSTARPLRFPLPRPLN